MRYADKYIELHLHLDGAITPDIARRLAILQGISLPPDDELSKMLVVPPDNRDLNEFLKCFELPLSLMQTKEALSAAAKLAAEKMISQNVVYAEIRFAPQLHTQKGLTQRDAVEAVLGGLKSVENTGFKYGVILCCMRGEGNEKQNFETVDNAKEYLTDENGVAALDLAGAEGLFPTKNYRELFAKAREYNIPFTIHAGEADGAESVRYALEYGAARIGHGVRSFEDEQVIKLLKENCIPLEMCPTSNRMTNAVADMADYPLMTYLKNGLKVTINTDDPALEGTTLADEFLYMEKTFGLSVEDEKILTQNAIDAAFTSDRVKNELRKMFE